MDELLEAQHRGVWSALGRWAEAKASAAAVDQGFGEDRWCPWCDAPGGHFYLLRIPAQGTLGRSATTAVADCATA